MSKVSLQVFRPDMKTFLWLLSAVLSLQNVTSQISMLESGPGIVRPSETLDLTCKVTGASLTDSTNMHCVDWVRQPEGKGLEWLGRICYENSKYYAQSLQGRMTLTRDTNKGEVYCKFTGVKREESGTYYCAREGAGPNWFDVWGQGTHVTVTSVEKSGGILLPLIPCCDVLKDKEKITVGCLLKDAIPFPEKISWNDGLEKDAKLMKVNQNHLMSSFLTITNSEWEKKPLTCSNDRLKSEVKVPGCAGVVKIPHIEIFLPPFDDSIEDNKPLVCFVSDFTPKQIQVVWLKNGKEHASKLSTFKVLKDEHGLFSGTIRLNVSKKSWNNGDKYTCQVDMKGDIFMQNISKCSDNFGKPIVNLELPSIEDLMHGNGRVLCSVLGTNLETYQISLKFDNKNINAIEHQRNSLSVEYSHNVSQESWKSVKTVSCVAQSPCPLISIKESKKVDHTAMDNKHPTIQILATCVNWTQATLFCLVSDFWPHHISIDWFKNGKILTESGKDFAAMLNKKDNTYFGKSEISVNWVETDAYTCKVSHQGQDSLTNITKCSACKNNIEEPVVELKLPSNEDLQKGNAKIICLIRVSNLDNNQVSLKLNNEMKRPQIISVKNLYTAEYGITKDELKGIKTVTCAVNRSCSPIPIEISKGVDSIIDPMFPDILTSFGNSNMTIGTVSLFCVISNYWPHNAKLVWLKNGNKLDEKETEFTSMKQENGMYSGKSFLNVTIESWNKDIYSCQVTHQTKSVTKIVGKPQVPDGDIVKPSFRDLFLSKNATVSCRTNMVHAEIQWIENGKPKGTKAKNEQIIFRNTTWVQSSITISLADWKNILSLSCKLNPHQEHLEKKMTILRTKIDVKVPVINLLPPDQETVDDHLMLICLVMDFYPEDIFITWRINGSSKEEVSDSIQVNCNHNTKQCSAISQLKVQKSEWLKGMTYSCLVAHISSEVYTMKNISDVPNKSVEAFITPEPSIEDLLLSENATISCGTSAGINDINWLLNETEIPTLKQKNDEQMHKNVKAVQVTIEIPLEEWKTSPTQFCKKELFNITEPNIIKQPKVFLFPPTNQRVEEDNLTLICLVNGFYPEEVFVTWKVNDTTIKQGISHPKDVICDPQKHLCSYVSRLPILKEEWLGGMSYACLVAHLSSKHYIRLNISKPNDIHTLYQDDGGEELQELEEINNVWTTTSTFIVLFLVTLIYSSFVTFVKVK